MNSNLKIAPLLVVISTVDDLPVFRRESMTLPMSVVSAPGASVEVAKAVVIELPSSMMYSPAANVDVVFTYDVVPSKVSVSPATLIVLSTSVCVRYSSSKKRLVHRRSVCCARACTSYHCVT
jgi:hypothetical protein